MKTIRLTPGPANDVTGGAWASRTVTVLFMPWERPTKRWMVKWTDLLAGEHRREAGTLRSLRRATPFTFALERKRRVT